MNTQGRAIQVEKDNEQSLNYMLRPERAAALPDDVSISCIVYHLLTEFQQLHYATCIFMNTYIGTFENDKTATKLYENMRRKIYVNSVAIMSS